MDKLEQIKAKIEEIQAKSAVSKEMKAFITLVLSITAKSKEELAQLSKENIQTIKDAISYISKEHDRILSDVSSETKSSKKEFDEKIKEFDKIVKELKSIKYKDGIDGVDGKDGINGKDGNDGSPDTPKEIKDKLETLKDEKRLDVSAIKGLEKLEKSIENRAIEILDNRTRYLVNRTVKHDGTLIGSGTDADPLKVANDVNAVWGSISGNIANQTDLTSNFLKLDQTTPQTTVGTFTFPAITVDTDTLFVDSVNHRVGIGTTNPGAKLEVAGNINIDGASAYLYGGQNAIKLATKGDTIDYSSTIIGRGAGDTKTDGTTTKQTALGYYAGQSNTGASQTALGSIAGYQNTGSYQTALGSYAGYQNTGASQTSVGYFAGYSNTGAYQTSVGYFAGRQNSGHRVTGVGYEATRGNLVNDVVAIGYQAGKDNTVANQFIVKQANLNAVPLIQGDFATGNVGIGTTSPVYKLDVQDSVTGALSSRILNTNAAGYSIYRAGASGVELKFGSYGSDYANPYKLNSVLATDGTKLRIAATNASGVITFHTAGQNDTNEKMRIDVSGKVGIGTTSPTEKLDVNGNIAITKSLARAESYLYINRGTDGKDAAMSAYGSNGSYSWYTGIPYNLGLVTNQYVIGSDRNLTNAKLIIDNTGNVGIGTTSPSTKLQVNGEITKGSENSIVSGVVFTQTADKTIGNTTTETTMFSTGVGSLTIPANSLVAGRTYRIKLKGYASGTNGDTSTLKVKLGSTELVSSTGTWQTLTDIGFTLEFDFTCRTTGATGTVVGNGYSLVSGGQGFSTVSMRALLAGTDTLNTTIDQVIDLTYQWSSASAGNTVTITNASIEVLN